MGTNEVDTGDRVQLPRALVQDELDVAERLEPSAEARLRPADPLATAPTRPRSM